MALILVADDDPDVRTALRRQLGQAGYGVLVAENGRACLDLIQQHEVDIVIVDIFMPELDGIELTAQLVSKHHTVKILAISGGGSVAKDQALEIALRFGAAATLAKPFEREDLLATVRDLLRDR